MNRQANVLPLGEKIKQIRMTKGLSQKSLADAMQCSEATISRIENGQLECSPEMLAAIKKVMGVENAPLFDYELTEYKYRLMIWWELIVARKITEAKALQNKLSPIMYLPFERDLYLQFNIIEANLLMLETNVPAAEERVNTAEALLENTGDDTLYLFHYGKGLFHAFRIDFVNALKHLLKAYDLKKSEAELLLSIAIVYKNLSKPYKAIKFFELAKEKYGGEYFSIAGSRLACFYASCCMHINQHDKAKTLLDEALAMARSINDEGILRMVLATLALHYIKTGDYKAAVEFSNKVLEYGQLKNDKEYEITLFYKGLALLKIKDFAQVQEVVEHGLSISKENELFTISFNTLGHLMTLYDSTSTDYIEDIAIPYYRAANDLKYLALDLCKELEQHYKKKNVKKAGFAIAVTIRELYEEMFMGDV